MFQNKMLRRKFGPNREKVVGGWRKLYNEKFHNLLFSPNIINAVTSKRTRWVGHVAAWKTGEKCI
jgi:hypothetical protein